MQLHEVLRRPLITEKYTALQAFGKYAFEVNLRATKPQIREAVEKAFKVKVLSVNAMTISGKRRNYRGRPVTPRAWKKAVVTLKEGDKIEFFAAGST